MKTTARNAIVAVVMAAVVAFVPLFSGCDDRIVAASDLGEEMFSRADVSTSRFNTYSCATCHSVDISAPVVIPGRLDSGYNLAGTLSRRTWWGGGTTTLLDAINVCVTQFMGGRALAPEEQSARVLYEYLAANDVGPGTTPGRFTIERNIPLVADFTGDGQIGSDLYGVACRRCHGEAHTGAGANSAAAVLLPDWPRVMSGDRAREVTIEKIRHGRFFNFGGVMPPYSIEALTNEQIGHILAFLGL